MFVILRRLCCQKHMIRKKAHLCTPRRPVAKSNDGLREPFVEWRCSYHSRITSKTVFIPFSSHIDSHPFNGTIVEQVSGNLPSQWLNPNNLCHTWCQSYRINSLQMKQKKGNDNWDQMSVWLCAAFIALQNVWENANYNTTHALYTIEATQWRYLDGISVALEHFAVNEQRSSISRAYVCFMWFLLGCCWHESDSCK